MKITTGHKRVKTADGKYITPAPEGISDILFYIFGGYTPVAVAAFIVLIFLAVKGVQGPTTTVETTHPECVEVNREN